jgi:hypothetical protein
MQQIGLIACFVVTLMHSTFRQHFDMLVIVHSNGNEILKVKQRDAWNYLALVYIHKMDH